MSARIDMLAALPPERKAALISAQVQHEMRAGLWRAALGSDRDVPRDTPALPGTNGARPLPDTDLDALLGALGIGVETPAAPTHAPTQCGADSADSFVASASPLMPTPTGALSNLGANASYAHSLQQAAERTGVPAPALAAIVDAEAARGAGGAWNPYSRNPRSSAAGLGQFLSRTWIGMAEQNGSWLNAHARAQGWIDDGGKVRGSARGALLALRYDPVAAIETVADYSRDNIARLRRSGVAVGEDVGALSQAAYLGHHLGPGDALRFTQGGLAPSRARDLLRAQIGTVRADEQIAAAGDATRAHRQWLTSYIGNKVRPDRYTG